MVPVNAVARVASWSIGIVGLAVGVLDLLGLLQGEWLSSRQPGLTLLVLSAIAIFIGLTYESRLDAFNAQLEGIKTDLEQAGGLIVAAIAAPHTVRFHKPSDFYEYCVTRMHKADEMSDLTWGVSPRRAQTQADANAYEAYRSAIVSECQNRSLRVREVFTMHVPIRAKRLLDVLDAPGIESYSAKFYELDHQATPPLIQLTIFDGVEVLFGPHRADALPAQGEVYLSVRDPLIVQLCVDYFSAVWLRGTTIKDGLDISEEQVERIRAHAQGPTS